jgi:hypothetical protein
MLKSCRKQYQSPPTLQCGKLLTVDYPDHLPSLDILGVSYRQALVEALDIWLKDCRVLVILV